MTLPTTAQAVSDGDLAALRSAVDGTVLTPSDVGWDAARAAWNTAVDRRPDLIALPRSTADVAAVITFARAHGLRVAPQCTGHNASALPSLAGAVLMSMVNMTDVSVDPDSCALRVQAGTRWAAATAAIDPHGLFAASGSSPDVGVVGYVLGGGLSLMGRTLGLAANHVTSLEVVTPDGDVHSVTAQTDADLFWALRGGGANFGVVTAMELRLFPLIEVTAGMFVWPHERRHDVLEAWHRWTRTASQATTTAFRIIGFPPSDELPPHLSGQHVVVIDGVIVGDGADDATDLLADLRALTPQIDTWSRRSPAELEHLHLDPGQPTPFFSTSALLDDIDGAGLAAFADALTPPSPLMFVELRHLGGALAADDPDGGATRCVPGDYLFYAVALGTNADLVRPTLDELQLAMAPYANGKSFANFTEHPTKADCLYPDDDWDRLRRLRDSIDPDDVMLASHSISAPARAPEPAPVKLHNQREGK